MSDKMYDMKTLSVREAQHGFAAMLDRVVRGEEVEITRHRKAIARIVPVSRRPRKIAWPDVLARLQQDFDGKVTSDSASLFDDMRSER